MPTSQLGPPPAERPSALRWRLARDHAEVGVGTLIVFIAMVLVAAVAAAVIIGTSGELQGRAQSTGQEATREVTSNLDVLAMYGVRNSTSDDLWDLKLVISLPAGATMMDLSTLLIRQSDGTTVHIYQYTVGPLADGAPSNDSFVPTWIRGGTEDAVMDGGDLVELHFNARSTELAPRTELDLTLLPEVGAHKPVTLRTPSTYASDVVITLM